MNTPHYGKQEAAKLPLDGEAVEPPRPLLRRLMDIHLAFTPAVVSPPVHRRQRAVHFTEPSNFI